MLIAVTVAALTLNAQKPRYELLWKDSFRGKELSDRWSKIPRGTSDWNNYMSSCDDCYKIGGGKLSLIGIVNDCLPSDSAPYLTGVFIPRERLPSLMARSRLRRVLKGRRVLGLLFGYFPRVRGGPTVARLILWNV